MYSFVSYLLIALRIPVAISRRVFMLGHMADDSYCH